MTFTGGEFGESGGVVGSIDEKLEPDDVLLLLVSTELHDGLLERRRELLSNEYGVKDGCNTDGVRRGSEATFRGFGLMVFRGC